MKIQHVRQSQEAVQSHEESRCFYGSGGVFFFGIE
jgi:hypothetical protein